MVTPGVKEGPSDHDQFIVLDVRNTAIKFCNAMARTADFWLLFENRVGLYLRNGYDQIAKR
jgi:hypothetical protein